MSTVGDLKRILEELNAATGSDCSAVVSLSGIPIAWDVPDEVNVDHFATLSATLLGASEVVYTSLNKPAPGRVIVPSGDGSLVAMSIGDNALLVAVSNADQREFMGAVEAAAKQIVGIMSRART